MFLCVARKDGIDCGVEHPEIAEAARHAARVFRGDRVMIMSFADGTRRLAGNVCSRCHGFGNLRIPDGIRGMITKSCPECKCRGYT